MTCHDLSVDMQGQVGEISQDIFWKHANFSLAESRTEPLASEMRKGVDNHFSRCLPKHYLLGLGEEIKDESRITI